MNNFLNIFVICEMFWPEYSGWINQTLNLMASCNHTNVRFNVITRKNRNIREKSLNGTDRVIRIWPGIDRQNIFFRFIFLFIVSIYLAINWFSLDVIYLPIAYLPLTLLVFLGKVIKKPVIVRVAINELYGTNLASRVRIYTICRATAIVVLNKEARKKLIELGVDNSKIFYIPNGVNLEKFRKLSNQEKFITRKEFNIDENDYVISFMGIINKRKGVDILLESIKTLSSKYPSLRLILIGPLQEVSEIDPSFVSSIKTYIESNRLERIVLVLGKLQNPEKVIGISDAFVLPSLSEGMPNALLEAMATGLPCIASDIPGVNDVLTSDMGVLVKPADSVALAEAIEKVIENKELGERLGENALNFIRNNLSIDSIVAKYQSLFINLAEENYKK